MEEIKVLERDATNDCRLLPDRERKLSQCVSVEVLHTECVSVCVQMRIVACNMSLTRFVAQRMCDCAALLTRRQTR